MVGVGTPQAGRGHGNQCLAEDHADHHMSVLLDPRARSTNAICKKYRDPEHLEPKKAPEGWFPDAAERLAGDVTKTEEHRKGLLV